MSAYQEPVRRSRFRLATLDTESPVCERFNAASRAPTLNEVLSTYRGIAETVLKLAENGVHCRRLEPASILLDRSSGLPLTAGPFLTGLDQARLHNQKSHGQGKPMDIFDSAKNDRQATATAYIFRCSRFIEARHLQRKLFKATEALEKHDDAAHLLVEKASLEEECATLRSELRKHMHRSIDDLETILWCLLYSLAKIGEQKQELTAIGEQNLKDTVLSQSYWTLDHEFSSAFAFPRHFATEVSALAEELAKIVNVRDAVNEEIAEERVRKEAEKDSEMTTASCDAPNDGARRDVPTTEEVNDDETDEGPVMTKVERTAFAAFITAIQETEEALRQRSRGDEKH